LTHAKFSTRVPLEACGRTPSNAAPRKRRMQTDARRPDGVRARFRRVRPAMKVPIDRSAHQRFARVIAAS